MQESNEKGITLVALVITIILLLIIASIGINSGKGTIEFSKYSQFKEELKLLQTKVNELNQEKDFEIGSSNLTEAQENKILDNIEDATEDIIDGFRYCSIENIKNKLNLEVERDYLINIEYRYVICLDGFEYKGERYYMLEQIDSGFYNVRHNDKNPKTGDFDFDVSYARDGDRWKVQILNIQYNGYIENWNVRYRFTNNNNWTTVNSLSFYIKKEGDYYVQVFHDDIVLGSKLIEVTAQENGNNEINLNELNEINNI